MLKNQDAVPEPLISTPPLSIAQARVTPSELTQALAAIEARRQAEASRLAETIPIDQAVSDLHLDSTSDEIWAEVQAQRAKAAQEARQREAKLAEQQESQRQQRERKPIKIVPSPVVGQPLATPRARPLGWRRLVAPVLVIGVLMGTGVIPHSFTPHGFSPSLLTQKRSPVAAPILRPLTQEPDGKEVYADDAALVQISEGKPVSQIIISENATGNRWPLVKMGGHVYLHGFTADADSLTSLSGKALPVYNDSDSGELNGVPTSRIILRVDDVPLQKSGGNSDYSSITVPNFQPDSFTTLTPGR